MAQYIKTFLRVRPSIATDPPGGSCLSVKNDTTLEIKRPGELPRVVDRVFSDIADNSAVWDVVGSMCMEYVSNGKHAVISVYGETGSGKTHTVRGANNGDDVADSLLGKIIEQLAGNEESNLTIVYVHNDSIQDLVNGSDNLKIKVDDSGATVEGATTVRIPNVNAGIDHVKKCIAKRSELFAKSPFDETNTFVVYMFGQGAGRLTVIECCGSERCYQPPAALSADTNKEVQAKNKILMQLNKCWIDAATNADPKAIAWKDTKIGRFLQPGLSAGMDQVGFACQIVCVTNHKDRTYETAASCQYAESSVKQESLKTVSEYKEVLANLEERIELASKEKPTLSAEMNAEEANAKKVKAENEARLEELSERSKALDMKVVQTRAQYEKEIEKLKKDIEKKRADLEKKNNEEVERMRNLAKNAPAQAASDIKKKVAEVEEEHKQSLQKVQQETTKLKTEIRNSKDQFDQLRLAKEQLKLDEAEAMKPVKELEKELFKLKANMTFAMKNREDGLSPEELLVKRPMWEIRDECDDLDDDLQRFVPEVVRLEAIVEQKIGKPAESESEKDSESDSDESEKSEESEKPPPETKEERLERLAKEKEERRVAREAEKKRLSEKAVYDREWKHFRETTRKDQFLSDLLEKILMYLEYGTNVTVLTANGLERRFVFFNKGRKVMTFVPAVRDGAIPNRKEVLRALDLPKIAGLHMGQHSPFFQIALRKLAGRVDPARSEPPPSVEELENSNLHRYYYRSFSIQFPTKEEGFVDVICDTDTDFEALIVALHRISGRNAAWGKNLFIELAPNVDELNEQEKLLCESIHLTPDEYLASKEIILLKDDKLFVTLHDLRVLTALDLYHSQKLLELWLKMKWVVRRQVNYYKYQEVIAEEAARVAAQEEAEREAALHAEESPEAEEAPEPEDDDDDDDDSEDDD